MCFLIFLWVLRFSSFSKNQPAIIVNRSIHGLGSPENIKGSNNRIMIHVEGDLKVLKSFVLCLLLGLPVVAEYRFRWLSCIFIPVDKLQLLHHPDVLQSSAIANSLIQRLFKWIWSSLLELFKVFFTWIYLIVEQ